MRFTSATAVLLCCAGLARAEAPQLEVKIEGDTTTLSGVADAWRDRSKLWGAIKGKRAVIFRDLRAESIDSAFMLAKVVKQANTTTVLDGDCDETCLPMFMGGFNRQWLLRPGTPPSTATLANRPRTGGPLNNSNNQVINDQTAHTYYAQQFIAMPHRILQTYILERTTRNGVLFVAPSADKPGGEGLQCENVARRDLCVPNKDLTPLTVGLVTTLDSFSRTPANLSAPAPVTVQPEQAAQPAVPPPAVTPRVPTQLASQVKAGAVLTARNVTQEDGPTAISSSFNQEGRIFVFVPFSWPVDTLGGSHTFETHWYHGGQMVHRSQPQTLSWQTTPGAAAYAIRAAEYGTGSFRVEAWLDGKLVGSKEFMIRAD